MFSPEYVVPAALFLVSEDSPTNAIVGAGAGAYHTSVVTMNHPILLPEGERTVEGFAAHWAQIADRASDFVPQSGGEQANEILALLQKAMGK